MNMYRMGNTTTKVTIEKDTGPDMLMRKKRHKTFRLNSGCTYPGTKSRNVWDESKHLEKHSSSVVYATAHTSKDSKGRRAPIAMSVTKTGLTRKLFAKIRKSNWHTHPKYQFHINTEHSQICMIGLLCNPCMIGIYATILTQSQYTLLILKPWSLCRPKHQGTLPVQWHCRHMLVSEFQQMCVSSPCDPCGHWSGPWTGLPCSSLLARTLSAPQSGKRHVGILYVLMEQIMKQMIYILEKEQKGARNSQEKATKETE